MGGQTPRALKKGRESEGWVADCTFLPVLSACLPRAAPLQEAEFPLTWHFLAFMNLLYPSTSHVICSSSREPPMITPAQIELAMLPERKILEPGD